MRRLFSKFVIAVALSSALLADAPVFAADDYTVDPVHSSVTFKIQHLGISWLHGRFNTFNGSFSIDKADPAKSSFEFTINADSYRYCQQAARYAPDQPRFLRRQPIPHDQVQEHPSQADERRLRGHRRNVHARKDETHQLQTRRRQRSRGSQGDEAHRILNRFRAQAERFRHGR